MTTVTLEIEDSQFEQFMMMIGLLKSDIIKHFEVQKSDTRIPTVDLANDLMAQELKRRIQEIDDGTVELTPYSEGMNSMMERIRVKYAASA